MWQTGELAGEAGIVKKVELSGGGGRLLERDLNGAQWYSC